MIDEFVQVYVNGGVVPICWEQRTRNEVGNTVCKQLGLDGAESTGSVRYTPHIYNIRSRQLLMCTK